jgi:hypothetical protein
MRSSARATAARESGSITWRRISLPVWNKVSSSDIAISIEQSGSPQRGTDGIAIRQAGPPELLRLVAAEVAFRINPLQAAESAKQARVVRAGFVNLRSAAYRLVGTR